MRIAISALMGMTAAVTPALALAQQAVPPPITALPPPGTAPLPEPPAPVPSPFDESPDERMDLAGWRDGFFLRDPRDLFRLHPQFLAEIDFYSSFGPGVSPDLKQSTALPSDVAVGLKPHLSLRRVRLGFEAELLRRWSAGILIEFGGQPIGNTNGAAETYAAKPGQAPSETSGRYAAVQSVVSAPIPLDVFINYSVCKCFNIQLGQFMAPASLDNRTGDFYYAEMERTAAMRSFLMQNNLRDIGGMLWGELGPRVLSYELGVFGGDGQNRPSVDARVDFMGRIFVRPFAGMGKRDIAKYTQIGVSARHGDRDPKAVAYDYGNITTSQGFVLWKPTYTDSLDRVVHVIPSGSQNHVGGELRLQVGRFALRGEAYYVANDAREAVDGYQLTNTERFTRVTGVGWYGQISVWPVGDAFVGPEPGILRPRHPDLNAKPPMRMPHGLEVIASVSGINAKYGLRDTKDEDGEVVKSTADPKTPLGDIAIYQLGLQANYWHTKHVRFGVGYSAYFTPGSGTADNLALVPDNLTKALDTQKANAGHILHELGARVAVAF